MKRLAGAAGVLVAGYGALQWLGRSWGATTQERHERLPGDELVAGDVFTTTHAITIDAPPEAVWPWIIQMGYHRGGWYTSPWIDRHIVHTDNPSTGHIVEELQHVEVGDTIPDGEPGTAFYVVKRVDPQRVLVLHSDTHLPPAWREPSVGAWVDWTWAFVLCPVPGDRPRVIVRVRGRCGPWWVRAVFVGAIIPADFVMCRSMLRGIKERAEYSHRSPVVTKEDERWLARRADARSG